MIYINRILKSKILFIVILIINTIFLYSCNNKVTIKNDNESIMENNNDSLNMLDTFEIKKGKVTFVNFWATWCGPCVGEMGDLQALYNEMKDDENVEFIFVNLGDPKNVVEKFMKDNKYTLPMYCDESNELTIKYDIYAIPQTFIYDKDGNIVEKIVGSNPKEVYRESLKKVLEK